MANHLLTKFFTYTKLHQHVGLILINLLSNMTAFQMIDCSVISFNDKNIKGLPQHDLNKYYLSQFPLQYTI